MTVHSSDCRLHDGPARIPSPCSCGADDYMDPLEYRSEFPTSEMRAAYVAGFHDAIKMNIRAEKAAAEGDGS